MLLRPLLKHLSPISLPLALSLTHFVLQRVFYSVREGREKRRTLTLKTPRVERETERANRGTDNVVFRDSLLKD